MPCYPTHVRSRCRHAFTLVEAIVVLAILVVLLSLVLPAVQQIRDTASRTQCASQLRQLALGVHLYSDSHQRLPRGCDYPFPVPGLYPEQGPGLSWQTSILPYIEQYPLWELAWSAHKADPHGHISSHSDVAATILPLFLCPSQPTRTAAYYPQGEVSALTSYQGVAGTAVRRNDGVFHKDYTVRFVDITDGLSFTLMIGERPSGPRPTDGSWYSHWGCCPCGAAQILPAGRNDWLGPDGIDCTPSLYPLRPGTYGDDCDLRHFWSLHRQGANFAFADGSIRFLRYSETPILRDLATRAGGEISTLD